MLTGTVLEEQRGSGPDGILIWSVPTISTNEAIKINLTEFRFLFLKITHLVL